MKNTYIIGAAMAATATAVLVYANLGIGAEDKIGWSLQTAVRNNSSVSVIVVLKEQADLAPAWALQTKEEKGRYVYNTLKETAIRSQTSLIELLSQRSVSFKPYYISNMISIENASTKLIKELSERSDVKRVILNPTLQNLLPTSDFADVENDVLGIGDNIVSTGANKVWADFKARGKGIVVAGQDTGVEWQHPALKGKYRGNNANGQVDHRYSWHDAIKSPIAAAENECGYNKDEPCDDHAHGTHTMGTIVGDDGVGNQIGMAPEAQWMACRNMDQGNGKPSTYIECFEFFLAPYPQNGNAFTDGLPEKAPHVMNNSWGCPAYEGCEGKEFEPVLRNLAAAGIFVVASAGNDGPACSTIADAPAHHSFTTFSVGAHDHRTNKIASFSSRGPSKFDQQIGPDVTAPGEQIRSSVPGGKYDGSWWSGTSMAGPHVVGAVALLWSAQPRLVGRISETAAFLTSTAVPTKDNVACGGVAGDKIPNNTYGFGLLNVFQAVSNATR